MPTTMIHLIGDGGRRHVTVSIDDALARRPAIDFVFEVLGAERLEALVEDGMIAEADLADMRALQAAIFDRDAEGLLIRDGVGFSAGGRELDPDRPLSAALLGVEQNGLSYRRCDITIEAPGDRPPAAAPQGQALVPRPQAPGEDREAQMRLFARMLFLHRILNGTVVDVTKDSPDLHDLVAAAEKEQLIDIDVARAAYKLTPAGQRLHEDWIGEAQELVLRYDIYGDVDVDGSGRIRFDTGLGEDWRVAAYEEAGLDPFKARFLIGLNDGEWDHLDRWESLINDPAWYEEVFRPIEQAPGVDDIGRELFHRVAEAARAKLREDEAWR